LSASNGSEITNLGLEPGPTVKSFSDFFLIKVLSIDDLGVFGLGGLLFALWTGLTASGLCAGERLLPERGYGSTFAKPVFARGGVSGEIVAVEPDGKKEGCSGWLYMLPREDTVEMVAMVADVGGPSGIEE
jgi:hypothetical protein